MSHLTRSQFERACRILSGANSRSLTREWYWNEHAYPGLGYLAREITIQKQSFSALDEFADISEDLELACDEDGAAADLGNSVLLVCRQYIVYSATFQVPTFYFTVHNSGGAHLSLTEVLSTEIFVRSVLAGNRASSFSVSGTDSNFPLLSYGDHPILGTPCWYLHPCETASAVGEILKERNVDELVEDKFLVRWMEVWFMVLSTVMRLDVGT